MNKLQLFIAKFTDRNTTYDKEYASVETLPSARSSGHATRTVPRRPSAVSLIVFLDDIDPFDVGLVKMSLDKMFRSSFFSICEVTEAMSLMKLSRSNTQKTLQRLRMLHCVHWCDMPKEVNGRIPGMISELFTEGAFLGDNVVSDQ